MRLKDPAGLGMLLVRADASEKIGSGHIMRCLALAQAWQDAGGCVAFVMARRSPGMEERLLSEQVRVECLELPAGTLEDAQRTADLAQRYAAKWVVIDGYHLGADYQRELKEHGLKLLCIDDHGTIGQYHTDVILDQNTTASAEQYRQRCPTGRLLLGSRFALLRREFIARRNWKREVAPFGHKVLVTMGGSDPANVTLKVIEALAGAKIDGLECMVVAGGSNPHVASLEAAVRHAAVPIHLVKNATNMPELMAWADIAIAGAGSTCWEMCLLGLPALLIDLAENQLPIARRLAELEVSVHIGDAQSVTPANIALCAERLLRSQSSRTEMSRKSADLVDGDGAARALVFLRSELRLRKVASSDCALLWGWANLPEVRAVSFSSQGIPWEQHVAWFQTKVADENTVFYIAERAGQSIGQFRAEITGSHAAVSISLGRDHRGEGLGFQLLMLATEELLRHPKIRTIDAFVKPENQASIRLFRRAGFRQQSPKTMSGQQAFHFVLDAGRIGDE